MPRTRLLRDFAAHPGPWMPRRLSRGAGQRACGFEAVALSALSVPLSAPVAAQNSHAPASAPDLAPFFMLATAAPNFRIYRHALFYRHSRYHVIFVISSVMTVIRSHPWFSANA